MMLTLKPDKRYILQQKIQSLWGTNNIRIYRPLVCVFSRSEPYDWKESRTP